MALFDTDVLIDHLGGKKGAKEETFELLNNLKEISVDKSIVRFACEIKTRAKVYQLQLYDCIISATAIKFNQVLVTRNDKHYPDKQIKLFIPNY